MTENFALIAPRNKRWLQDRYIVIFGTTGDGNAPHHSHSSSQTLLSQTILSTMSGRLLASFCLGFLLLTQTYASPIPQSSTSTPGSSGAEQEVATTPDGTYSDGTTSSATETPSGTTGSASNEVDSATASSSAVTTPSTPSTSADAAASSSHSESSSSACGGGKYVVKDGDDCEAIAEKNKVSTLLLLQANGITDGCHSLHAGDTLCLPQQCYTYKAKTGDTCYKLTSALTQMLKKKVTVAMFQQWNQ